ncbi:MAG: SUF system Fe-S cluster assembly regulator [Candidatus Competibacteraceae bacterium]
MIRITRETDYGIVLMTTMARDANPPYSAAALAKQRGLPLPMVSKILKALARAGLLVSQRGALGGYSLARRPEDISAVDIIDALEGPIAITECSAADLHACMHEEYCTVSGHWHRINGAIREALKNISLLELSRPAATPIVFWRQRAGVEPVQPLLNHS